MPKVFIKDRNGKEFEINAEYQSTLMEILRDNGFDVEAACGGCCACATCHIYINDDWIDKLPKRDDDEESMLDQAFEVKKSSRLGCQIEFNEDLDGITLEIAPE